MYFTAPEHWAVDYTVREFCRRYRLPQVPLTEFIPLVKARKSFTFGKERFEQILDSGSLVVMLHADLDALVHPAQWKAAMKNELNRFIAADTRALNRLRKTLQLSAKSLAIA